MHGKKQNHLCERNLHFFTKKIGPNKHTGSEQKSILKFNKFFAFANIYFY